MALSKGMYTHTKSKSKHGMTKTALLKTKNLNRKLAKIFALRRSLHYKISSGMKDEWNFELKKFQAWVKAYFTYYFKLKKTCKLEDYPKSFLIHLAKEMSFEYICEEMIRSNDDKFITARWVELEQHCYITDPNIGYFQ
tara:strand:- start:316 stop:732 length:417 start_codon:yes stop_codon:yes gene_type:complete